MQAKAKAIAGIPEWCVIFELSRDLFAMVNQHPDEPTQFAEMPLVFTKHGYFVDADRLHKDEIDAASDNLANLDLRHARQLLGNGKIRLICSGQKREELIHRLEALA